MIKYVDLLKEYKKIMDDALNNRPIKFNKYHYYVLSLAKFIAIKELYIPKDCSNNEVYFDEAKNCHMIKPFSELAYYIKNQPNSYIKNNLTINLINKNDDLENTVWIINKLRDSLAHQKFTIDDENDMLIIDNDSITDLNHNINDRYKLKCEIPFEVLNKIFNSTMLETDFDKIIENQIKQFKDALNEKTLFDEIAFNDSIVMGYLMLFFMDESRKIDYSHISLNSISPLILTKDPTTYIDKKTAVSKQIYERTDKQKENVEKYYLIKEEGLKNHIIRCHINLITELKKSIALLYEENLTFVRNSILHTNLNISNSHKFNLADKKDQRKTGSVKIATFVSKEDIYNVTKILEKDNLSSSYTIKDFIDNTLRFGWECQEKIRLSMNEVYQLLYNEDLDESLMLEDYITILESKLKSYVKTKTK